MMAANQRAAKGQLPARVKVGHRSATFEEGSDRLSRYFYYLTTLSVSHGPFGRCGRREQG